MSEELFGPLFGDAIVEDAVSASAFVGAMLTVESALAASCADIGLVSSAEARKVAAACADLDVDMASLAVGATATGNPVVPLLTQLRARVPAEARDAIHLGATSQDIIDTAFMLVTRDAGIRILSLVHAASETAAALADADTEPTQDMHATRDYRRHLARTLTRRALETAAGRS